MYGIQKYPAKAFITPYSIISLLYFPDMRRPCVGVEYTVYVYTEFERILIARIYMYILALLPKNILRFEIFSSVELYTYVYIIYINILQPCMVGIAGKQNHVRAYYLMTIRKCSS